MSEPVIDIRDLEFRYARGGFVLRVPGLQIERGMRIAVIGPSGAGKTTLLSLAAGILRPSGGAVRVLGCELTSAGDREVRTLRIGRIGLVFQEFELLEYLTVRENILLPFLLADGLVRTRETERDVAELAAAAGLSDKLSRRPRALSQGERQRVAICRGLVTRPELLLADEPTGNLDPATTAQIVDLMLSEVSRRGTTVVMVTHNHDLLGRFDRVVDVEGFATGRAA